MQLAFIFCAESTVPEGSVDPFELLVSAPMIQLWWRVKYQTAVHYTTLHYTALHLFNGLFSSTTWVSRHQKSRTILVKKLIWIYWSKR